MIRTTVYMVLFVFVKKKKRDRNAIRVWGVGCFVKEGGCVATPAVTPVSVSVAVVAAGTTSFQVTPPSVLTLSLIHI